MKLTKQLLREMVEQEIKLMAESAWSEVGDSPFFKRAGPDEITREFGPEEKEMHAQQSIEMGKIRRIETASLRQLVSLLNVGINQVENRKIRDAINSLEAVRDNLNKFAEGTESISPDLKRK